jgi:hypothetical protein
MLSGEATNTNFIVFGLTRSGFEPTIYRTRSEHEKLYELSLNNNQYSIEKDHNCIIIAGSENVRD